LRRGALDEKVKENFPAGGLQQKRQAVDNYVVNTVRGANRGKLQGNLQKGAKRRRR